MLFNSLGDAHAVFMEIVARHCGTVRVDAESPWRDALAKTALFTSIGEHTTRFGHVVDADRRVSLAASIRDIAALPGRSTCASSPTSERSRPRNQPRS